MACLLFAGYAENYRTEGLMSGIVTERAAAFGTASSSGGSQPFDVASNEDLAVLAAASAPQQPNVNVQLPKFRGTYDSRRYM